MLFDGHSNRLNAVVLDFSASRGFIEMAAGGLHRRGYVRKSSTNCITIDTFDGAHTPAHAHLTVSSQLAARSRYM